MKHNISYSFWSMVCGAYAAPVYAQYSIQPGQPSSLGKDPGIAASASHNLSNAGVALGPLQLLFNCAELAAVATALYFFLSALKPSSLHKRVIKLSLALSCLVATIILAIFSNWGTIAGCGDLGL